MPIDSSSVCCSLDYGCLDGKHFRDFELIRTRFSSSTSLVSRPFQVFKDDLVDKVFYIAKMGDTQSIPLHHLFSDIFSRVSSEGLSSQGSFSAEGCQPPELFSHRIRGWFLP